MHTVTGVVVEGDHRGRTLGFPTANVTPSGPSEVPEQGVYGGYVERPDGSVHLAAISVGIRPTFYADEAPCLVEAHLLDFDGDLYGEVLTVTIIHHIRGQLRFESTDALVDQMAEDVEKVRATLGEARPRTDDPA